MVWGKPGEGGLYRAILVLWLYSNQLICNLVNTIHFAK